MEERANLSVRVYLPIYVMSLANILHIAILVYELITRTYTHNNRPSDSLPLLLGQLLLQ